ncbi:MAG: hypothetical protein K0R15_490 [Clostridiales bacterium]|jgi:similar to stage IV sporulation protein|nr:hypothetical protein [Clostridiales bacterium]
MQRLIKYLKGYLILYIKGFSAERFLNLCINRDIFIWDLESCDNGFRFKVSLKDFKRLRPIAKKTKTRPKIIKKYGLPFQLHRYKHRKAYAIGLIIAIVTLYGFSLFLWNISVTGTSIYTPENIIQFLKEENVYAGIKKNKINCAELEKKILYNFQDVAWVSLEVSGTRLIVNIIETNEHPDLVKDDTACDIVSLKPGIITKIVTRKGTPMIKIGDVVKQDDVLLSGTVNIETDGVITGIKYVHADADVYAKTVLQYTNTVPLDYEQKVYSNKKTKTYGMFFGDYKLYLFHPKIKYKNYESEANIKQFKLWGDYYLPIGINTKEYIDYDIVRKTYSEEEVTFLLNDTLNKYIETLEKKGVQIIENNVKITLDNKNAIAKGNLILIENIGYAKEIEIIEWRPPTNESN